MAVEQNDEYALGYSFGFQRGYKKGFLAADMHHSAIISHERDLQVSLWICLMLTTPCKFNLIFPMFSPLWFVRRSSWICRLTEKGIEKLEAV